MCKRKSTILIFKGVHSFKIPTSLRPEMKTSRKEIQFLNLKYLSMRQYSSNKGTNLHSKLLFYKIHNQKKKMQNNASFRVSKERIT
jgi:hypothetical protein